MINTHRDNLKKIIWTINRYKWFLNKETDINKIEEYSIKLENLETEEEIINTEIYNTMDTFKEFRQNLSKLSNFFINSDINKKRIIIGLLFEKLVVNEKYIYLYTYNFLTPIFNLKTSTLVIKKNL